MPSMSTGGAAMNAIINAVVAVSKVGNHKDSEVTYVKSVLSRGHPVEIVIPQ
jgi:hypothetical protein